MKKILLQLAVVAVCCGCGQEAVQTQQEEPAEPQKIENPMVDSLSWAVTPVKDQARTGTCWA